MVLSVSDLRRLAFRHASQRNVLQTEIFAKVVDCSKRTRSAPGCEAPPDAASFPLKQLSTTAPHKGKILAELASVRQG